MSAEEQPVEIIPHTDEWFKARQEGFGASEIAALWGLHPYITFTDLILRKQGKIEKVKENEAMRRGTALEGVIAKAYEMVMRARGEAVELTPERFFKRDDLPYMFATPDRGLAGKKKHIQIKTHANRFEITSEYGESGSRIVPDHERLQITAEMAVTQNEEVDLVVYFASESVMEFMVMLLKNGLATEENLASSVAQGDLRIYTFSRDLDLENEVAIKAVQSWNEFIVAKTVPVDLRKYPATGAPRKATPAEEGDVAKLQGSWLNLKRAKVKYEADRKAMESIIDTAAGLETENYGTILWRKGKGIVKSVVDWEAMAKSLLRDFPEEMHAEVQNKFTKVVTKEGTRPFLAPREWKKLLLAT